MKTLFISFENYQELHELSLLIKSIKEDHPNWIFILFDTTDIYKLPQENLKQYEDTYTYIVKSVNNYELSFKKLSIISKMYVSLINIYKILGVFKKYHVDLMITGVPLFFFRFSSILNKKIFNISYMRALIISQSIEHSFSNKLSKIVKNIPILKEIPFFDSWYCDLLITVSEINRPYFLNKGLTDNKIKISGSLLLENITPTNDVEERLEIIFLTHAAAYHGNAGGDIEQLNVLKTIIPIINEKGIKFIIRVHPRDNPDDYNIFIQDNSDVVIDTSPSEEFLRSCTSNKVVVSAFSTLNFEWDFLGGKGYFYSTSELYKTYSNFYKTLEIDPYFDLEKLVQDICNGIPQKYYQNVYKQHNPSNIHFFKKQIYGVI